MYKVNIVDDVLELKRRYESLTEEQLLCVWADEQGLTDIARSILSEEMTRRGLRNDPRSQLRKIELQGELAQTRQRYERHQKRTMWRMIIYAICFAIAVVGALLKLLSK